MRADKRTNCPACNLRPLQRDVRSDISPTDNERIAEEEEGTFPASHSFTLRSTPASLSSSQWLLLFLLSSMGDRQLCKYDDDDDDALNNLSPNADEDDRRGVGWSERASRRTAAGAKSDSFKQQ